MVRTSKAAVPGTWWEGRANEIVDDTRIHVGRRDVVDACSSGGDIDPTACPGRSVRTLEDVERKADRGDEGAEEFVTELFFRCWWHDDEAVAEEFSDKGWKIDGEQIDEENVADLCYAFQQTGYGSAGFGA